MSNPALAAIGSTPSGVPGFSNAPTAAAAGNFGISSPGIAFANWMPTGPMTNGSNLGSVAGFMNNGIPPKSHGHVQFRSNDFVTHAYTIAPWHDGSHLQIMEGMPVFIGREMDMRTNLTNMVHLGKLNRLMQQARMDFDILSDDGNPDSDPEAVRFRQLLERYGERGLEQHHWARTNGKIGDLKKHLGGYNEGELNELWRLAHKPIYRYITRFGVLSHWNFAGFVVALSRGTSQETMDRTREEDTVLSVTVSLGKRTRVGALWGDRRTMRVGTQAKLVLRAKQLSDGSYGAMEIIPYACFQRCCVPASDKSYYDLSGHLIPGFVWSVGTVIEPPKRDGQESARQLSSGTALEATAKMAYEAFGTLPMCYLAVGM